MEILLALLPIWVRLFLALIYSLKRSLIEVFDLVFSSTCLIITAQLNDGADGFFLSGRVPGTLPDKKNPSGPSLSCAVIIKQVDEKTRSKTSINDLLRE